MKTKITYILDKTDDKELEYIGLLDSMIVMTNLLKARGEVPKEMESFCYDIVEDPETRTVEYTFIMEMGSDLLNPDEIRGLLHRVLGEL